MNKMYYAELYHGYIVDLWRFKSKAERDQWVAERPTCACAITSKWAREYHKEQFKYWENR